MVRFSCFLTPINYNRSKKVVQQSAGAMHSNPQGNSHNRAIKVSWCSDNNLSNTSVEQVTSPSSHEGCWKSDDLNGNSCPDESKEFLQMMRLKKSQPLGSVLDKRRGFSGDDLIEDEEMDEEFSFDYSHDNNVRRGGDSLVNTGSAEVDDHGDTRENTHYQCQEDETAESFELIADPEHYDSIFSIHSSSNTLPIFAKSCSVTNLGLDTANSIEGSLTHELTGPRSRSLEDLCSLHGGRDEFLNGDDALSSDMTFQRHIAASYSQNASEPSDLDGKGSPHRADSSEECVLSNTSGRVDQAGDGKYSSKKFKYDNKSVDGYKPHNYDNLANDWRELETDGVDIRKNLQQDSSIQNWDELTSEEFNIKRITEWISQIDIQIGSAVEELGECSRSVPKRDPHVPKKNPQVVAGVATTKHDANNLGMELAYNYISSLTASSSSAHMSNLGLVVVPFLCAFVSLRVLNLSGNAIVRITAGALPRGLHMLKLSKNNISTIEGLRDLTRLRVLDLSYNRIVRIGHGLASCSSLKEIYLAGNKISEVEGLHRLLKLNVLDLRFNKISTAKGLGQLAANYGSLQTINLEGNPAQRNVGDEQLKKYLLSLLPHLVYYNKQTIRASCSKDVSDRPPRSLASHQFDRGMRTEQNHSRRGSHVSALHRSPSSNHGQSSPAVSSSLKQPKNRHMHLRPAGSKATNHQPNAGAQSLNLQPSNPIR